MKGALHPQAALAPCLWATLFGCYAALRRGYASGCYGPFCTRVGCPKSSEVCGRNRKAAEHAQTFLQLSLN